MHAYMFTYIHFPCTLPCTLYGTCFKGIKSILLYSLSLFCIDSFTVLRHIQYNLFSEYQG